MKKIFTLLVILAISAKVLFGQQVIHACCDTFVCLPGTAVPLEVVIDSGNQGNLLNIADDIYSQVINIGFPFTYFGNTYTQCVLSTNVYISFNLANALQYSPWPISNAAPSALNPLNAIYGPWHDVDPAVPPFGTMGFGSFGTAPDRFFVFNFCSVPMFSCNDTLFTGQIILYETSNNIEIHLTEKRLCSTWNAGSAIEGLQDNTGTVAVIVPGRNYPTNWTAFNDAVRFTPSGLTYTISNIAYAPVPFVAGTPVWNTLNGNYVGTGYNITVNPVTTTSYVVTTASCGFSDDTVTVVVGSVPAIYDTINLSCTGSNDGAASVKPTDNSGPYTFVWTNSNGDTLQVHNGNVSDTLLNLTPGTYELWFVNSIGCSQQHEYTITEPLYGAAFTVSPVSICDGTATLFTDASFGNISAYSWSFGDGGTSSLQNPTHTYTTPGTYTITLTITTPAGCTDTAQVSYLATGSIQGIVNQLTDAKCFNSCDGTIIVSGSGGALPFSYSWSNGATTPGIANLCAGAYTVIISDSANCSDTLTLQINEPTKLYFVLDSIRNPGCYSYFDGYIKIEARGGTPNYLYAWQPYGGNSPIASHLNANTYSVEVKDAHSCLHDTTLQLIEPEPLVITYPGDTTICYGTEAVLNVPISGGTPPYTVDWNTGDISNPLFFEADFDSVIAVSAKDANGCTAGPVEYRVQVLHQPAVSLGNDTIMCAGDVLDKSIFQPGVLYEWQDGSKYYDYEIKEGGIYWVKVFNACFSSDDSVTVKFDDCTTCVHVPDAFTPNNDGVNDIFKAEIGCYFTNYLFKVFNRWGQLLFITSDPNGGWDGRNGGKAEEIGTYIWQLQYAGSEHDLSLDQKLTGYVVLIR